MKEISYIQYFNLFYWQEKANTNDHDFFRHLVQVERSAFLGQSAYHRSSHTFYNFMVFIRIIIIFIHFFIALLFCPIFKL